MQYKYIRILCMYICLHVYIMCVCMFICIYVLVYCMYICALGLSGIAVLVPGISCRNI